MHCLLVHHCGYTGATTSVVRSQCCLQQSVVVGGRAAQERRGVTGTRGCDRNPGGVTGMQGVLKILPVIVDNLSN